LSGETRHQSSGDKICPRSISSPWNRSRAEFWSAAEAVWEALRKEGLQMSYHSFHKTVSRSRKIEKSTAASSRGKQEQSSEAQALQETKVEAVEERDPFANLKRLEENRPGFHWRGTRNVKTSVNGREDSSDKHS